MLVEDLGLAMFRRLLPHGTIGLCVLQSTALGTRQQSTFFLLPRATHC
jgi:hypothetical protein